MSQGAVVAVAVAFIANGILTWAVPDMGAAMNWIISGIIAFIAGSITIRLGKG